MTTQTFTVTVERGRTNWWVLECPELGAVSQVRRIDQARDEMREAISYLSGLPESDFEISLELRLSREITENLEAVAKTKQAADQTAKAAKAAQLTTARELAAAGYSLRDIGTLLGISFQRVGQLLAA